MQKLKTISALFLILFTSMSLAMNPFVQLSEEKESRKQYSNLTIVDYFYMTPEQQDQIPPATVNALMDKFEAELEVAKKSQARMDDLNLPPRKFKKPLRKSCLEKCCCSCVLQ